MDRVRDAYDANAELYASLFAGELGRDAQSLRWLATFARQAAALTGPVVDLGCGPGDVVNHLTILGLTVTGIDLSPGQIDQARSAFPDLRFEVGDLTALDATDRSLGGIVARYSIIHLPPDELAAVFQEWRRVLQPQAPVFLAFFGSRSPAGHGTAFDHRVATAHELWPATVEEHLREADFDHVDWEATPIPEGGRPYDHVTLLAAKPDA